jgi:hypothetical protein
MSAALPTRSAGTAGASLTVATALTKGRRGSRRPP